MAISCGLLMGCMSLGHVKNYSERSSASALGMENINYSFNIHCLERCELAAIDSIKIYRSIPCECNSYRHADSVTRAIYRAIAGYFEGLARLSDNKQITFRLDPLMQAVKNEDLGVFHWKKEDAEAYNALGNVVLRAYTDAYRQRKIRDYVKTANPSLQVLLARLEFIASENLKGLLAFRKERLYADCLSLLSSPGLNEFEKRNAVSAYYQSLKESVLLERQLAAYARSLKTIGRGHQKLFDEADRISGDELKRSLPGYANDLQDLISAFHNMEAN